MEASSRSPGAQTSLEPRWLAARDFESKGDIAAATAAYQDILRVDPTQAFAWQRLSGLALAQGRYRQARSAALEGAAIAVASRRWKALPYLTRQLLQFDEREAVCRTIEAADWSDREILSQSATLAQQLWLADANDLALALTNHALKLIPRSHLLHYVRANVLMHQGKSEQASAAFEASIQLQPTFADAHWALAYHSKAEPQGSRVDRVKAALARAPEGSMQSVFLGYALFKELDDADETHAAWDALSAAAGVMRNNVKYDKEKERLVMQALRDVFVEPAASTLTLRQRTPIFIVGMPRTGTTVLDRILGNHSNVASAGELNVFSVCLGLALDRPFAVPVGVDAVNAAAKLNLDAVGSDYLKRTAAQYGQMTHLIDKNPLNFLNAGFIARALPEARILCLLRNPMDACFSNLKALFPGGGYGYSYDLDDLAAHYRNFHQLALHWQAVLPQQFRIVEYERLIGDTEDQARELMDFCGLPYEPDCVDIIRNQTPVSTASSSQVRQPIHARGIEAWRRYERQLAPLRERFSESMPQQAGCSTASRDTGEPA